MYKLYISKYIKSGKFLSLFVIYFKIQNLNIFDDIFSKIYSFLRGMFLFVFSIVNFVFDFFRKVKNNCTKRANVRSSDRFKNLKFCILVKK